MKTTDRLTNMADDADHLADRVSLLWVAEQDGDRADKLALVRDHLVETTHTLQAAVSLLQDLELTLDEESSL